jgi:hypothetical protein
MKKEYQTPLSIAEETIRVNMLCASGGGGGITPSHDTQPVTDGGDPNDAIEPSVERYT